MNIYIYIVNYMIDKNEKNNLIKKNSAVSS